MIQMALMWVVVYGVVAVLGVFGSVRQNNVRYAIAIIYVGLAWYGSFRLLTMGWDK